jgi:phage-related protein
MTQPRIAVFFFKTDAGAEPVRDWLKELTREDRKSIGEDIKTIQFGWPMGMPLVRKLEANLWEVRTQLVRRIARVIFTVQEDKLIMLHGFIKKSQKTSSSDLNLARQRLKQFKEQAS